MNDEGDKGITSEITSEIASVAHRVAGAVETHIHGSSPSVPPPALVPVMPHQDADPTARAKALEHAREEYVWDWSWPPGCATLQKVPLRDTYPPEYVVHITRLNALIDKNHVGMAIIEKKHLLPPAIVLTAETLARRFLGAVEDLHVGSPRVRPDTIDGYSDYYVSIARPPLVEQLLKDPASTDALFAWQRVAGANPMSLQRITALPEDCPVTEAHWTAAIGHGSLAAALADGRVYVVDFSFLHGAPATRFLHRQKYIAGVRGIFATPDGPLRPVAIQLEPGGAIYTPADGTVWKMARYCLQVADANVHETMSHLGTTHMVMEAVGIAGRRHLAETHPLRLLLEPHIEATFAINNSAKTGLIAPGGVIDKVFAARIDVAAHLVRVALDGFVLQDRAPSRELRARGVDDRERLPDYPYRDDVLPLYDCIERFVRTYVGLYYPDNAAVAQDAELSAWVADVGSPIGGGLRVVRKVETIDGLVEWMTNVVHIASAQHAAVNFPQQPFFSYAPNVAGACWAPPPVDHNVTDADLLALMPPWDCLLLQANSVYQLSSVHFNQLGVYPRFADVRVQPLVETFQRELAQVETVMAAADKDRLLTYPFLHPSSVPASIHI